MITIIISILIGYILPVIICWRWVHLAYSKGGISEYDKPTFTDFRHIILPIWNIFTCFIWFYAYPIKKDLKPKTIKPSKDYSKFFNIKN